MAPWVMMVRARLGRTNVITHARPVASFFFFFFFDDTPACKATHPIIKISLQN
jgi:hypothetical protein